jgi:hypothetical protein
MYIMDSLCIIIENLITGKISFKTKSINKHIIIMYEHIIKILLFFGSLPFKV